MPSEAILRWFSPGVRANPRPVHGESFDAGGHRNIYCEIYSRCLNFAAARNWDGFHCHSCALRTVPGPEVYLGSKDDGHDADCLDLQEQIWIVTHCRACGGPVTVKRRRIEGWTYCLRPECLAVRRAAKASGGGGGAEPW